MTVPLKLRTQPTPKSVARMCRWTLALRQTTDDKVASIGQERRLRVG